MLNTLLDLKIEFKEFSLISFQKVCDEILGYICNNSSLYDHAAYYVNYEIK